VVAATLAVPRDGRLALLVLVALSSLACLFLGSSKPAFIGALIGMIYLAALTLRPKRMAGSVRNLSEARLATAVLVLVLLIGVVVTGTGSDEAARVEPETREFAGKLVAENALLGVGSDHWDIILPLFHPREYGNEVIRKTGPPPPTLYRVWGEWGFLGFLGFLVFGLWLLSAPFRSEPLQRGWTIGFLAGFAGLFVTSFWMNPLSRPALHFLFWTLAAVAYLGTVSLETRRATASRRVPFRLAATAVCLAVVVVALARLSLSPCMATRHYLQALFWQGLAKARIAYKPAIELVPFHPYFWADYAENRVRVANNQDRRAEDFKNYAHQAEVTAGRALFYLPNEPALIFRYATALDLQHGRPWQKIILYGRAASLSPNVPSFHVNLGIAYMTLSGSLPAQGGASIFTAERAVSEWKKALDLDPSNLAAAYNLAEYARVHGRPEEAVHYARLILRRHPNDKRALELLESLGVEFEDLATQRQLESLAAYWEDQIERNPTDPSNYYRAGLIYEELGDAERATTFFTEAFHRDPEYLPAARKLKERGISLDRLLRKGRTPLEE
jgi:tetratricopeptide (TPR) repeat protein